MCANITLKIVFVKFVMFESLGPMKIAITVAAIEALDIAVSK